MTTNQTIDGVPRELRALLERIVAEPRDVDAQVSRQGAIDELRALLYVPVKLDLVECDACPTSGGCVSVCMKAPKPAAQPQGEPVAWLAQAVGKGGEVYRNKASTNELTMRDIEIAWGQGVIDRFAIVIKPLYAEQPAPVAAPQLEMTHVVRAHMEIPGCPVLTSNQCHTLAMKLNACLDEQLKSLNSSRPTHANAPEGADPSGTHHDNDGLDEWRNTK